MRKFEPGNVHSTPGVNAKLKDAGFMRFMIVSLNRHINGDWGSMRIRPPTRKHLWMGCG